MSGVKFLLDCFYIQDYQQPVKMFSPSQLLMMKVRGICCCLLCQWITMLQ